MVNILIHKDFESAAIREYEQLKSELKTSPIIESEDIKFYDDTLAINVDETVYVRFVGGESPFEGYKNFMYKTDNNEYIQATYGEHLDDCMKIESWRELYEGIIFLYGAITVKNICNRRLGSVAYGKKMKGDI